jgi:hypothetical protein
MTSVIGRGDMATVARQRRSNIHPDAGRSAVGQAYVAVKRGLGSLGMYSRLHDRIVFDDRRRKAPVLVCMLVGYKPDLWPFIFPRLLRSLPDADVCLVSPGRRVAGLVETCREHGWSYLSTATNDVALAQNVCYRLHDDATMIVKVDEDMFLLDDTISSLLGEYDDIKREGVVVPGFVAPMIPLNGFCYRPLLEMLGLLDRYERRFGKARMATAGTALQADPTAARWIWEHTAPLSATAARLAAMEVRRLFCPIQFSIGLIAFERRFWELIRFLPVYRRRLLTGQSTLGGDEAYICAKAVETSRPGVVTTAALAGHFSFGPQYAEMRSLLQSRPELFLEPRSAAVAAY